MQVGKLNPKLLHTLKSVGQTARRARRHPLGVAAVGMAGPRALVVLRLDSDKPIGNEVHRLGGEVHWDDGPIRTASIPLSQIAALSEFPAVRRIRLSRRLSPKLTEVTRLNRLTKYLKRPACRNCDGVLIGIVDSGLDGSHAAFADRVLEYWDQTASRAPGSPVRYGALITPASGTDQDGHGTHVMGIATGADAAFCGIAPSARLAVVKTDFEDAHIQDGVRRIFDLATKLHMPAVVNLSMGGHADAHDGTDDLDVLLDALSGPGRIVVAAAGNEGADNIHTMVELQDGDDVHLGFRIPRGLSLATLNVWYAGAGDIDVSVSTPFGAATAMQEIRPDNPDQEYRLASAGIVRVSTPGRHPINNDRQIYIEIEDVGAGQIQAGRWFLHMRCRKGAVMVHGWVMDEDDDLDVSWSKPVDSHLIGSPGAAASAITVAAYTSRVNWKTIDGSEWSLRYRRDRVAPFSSPGPLRNGKEKPDVAAGGAMVISARSGQATFDNDGPIDTVHAAMMGTSMASPVVTGLVATMLASDPHLTADGARDMLRKSAGRKTFRRSDGWGLVRGDGIP
jgi:subtilisin family serine protease